MTITDRALKEISALDQVDNVAIFISDSTRYDALPDSVAERGISGRAIAPSTYTASSIPSILSGQYPAEHTVWDFNGQLARTPLLFRSADHTGFHADTIWTHLDPADKPPLRMTRTSPGASIERLDEPFVYVEHDKGGHTPYGYSFAECESTEAYYEKHVNVPEDVPKQYARSVSNACERFNTMVDTLEDRGLLDRTLVIFTADHGELLGEPERGHVYGHGHPMTPELVYVPVVFCGAGLPEGESYQNLLSGIDIAPTALAARGHEVPNRLVGRDLWTNAPNERAHRSDIWMRATRHGRTVTYYRATSLWNATGGIVSHLGSRAIRTALSQYLHYHRAPHSKVIRPQWSPQAWMMMLRVYAPSQVSYGTIDGTLTAQKHTLPTAFDENPQPVDERPEEYSREQLEKLGYL